MTQLELEAGETDLVIRPDQAGREYVVRVLSGEVSFGHDERYARRNARYVSGDEGVLKNLVGEQSSKLFVHAHRNSEIEIDTNTFLFDLFSSRTSERPEDKAVRQGEVRNFSLLSLVDSNQETRQPIVSSLDTDIAVETVSWMYVASATPSDTLNVNASLYVDDDRIIGFNPSEGLIRNIKPPIRANEGDPIELEVFNDDDQDIEFELNIQAREIS